MFLSISMTTPGTHRIVHGYLTDGAARQARVSFEQVTRQSGGALGTIGDVII
jgi:hypothetical protein